MRKPSNLFLAVAGLGGCLFLLLCAITLIFGIYVARQQNFSFALPFTSSPGKIVAIDNQRNIVLIDPRTRARLELTKDGDGGVTREYDNPTWSPDSKYVAFVSYAAENNRPSASLFSIRADGSQLTSLFNTDSDFPLYLYWSPNSQHMSFLTQKERSLSLRIAQPGKRDSAQELENGSPLYWAWSPDSRTLLMHIGGAQGDTREARVSLLNWQSNPNPQKLNLGPASFQSPQWSPDGKQVLFAVSENAQQDILKVADARGENAKTVVEYSGRIAFAWSPLGNQIAYIATPRNIPLPTFDRLRLVNADGTRPRELSAEDERALAFFWSPDGKYLAFLVPTDSPNEPSGKQETARPLNQDAELYFRLRVLEVESGKVRTTVTFTPTGRFISLLPFFDQYARSITFWSPDSQSIVYSARDPNIEENGTVWTVRVKEGSRPEQIGDGIVAFWSWK